MNIQFKARQSINSIILTILSHFIALTASYLLLLRDDLLKQTHQPPTTIKHVVVFMLLISFSLAFLLRPLHYKINKDAINIKKIIFTKKIRYDTIIEIKPISYNDLAIDFRLFGSGGIWGYFGLYNSSYFGRIRMNATQLKNLVFIATSDKKIFVLSTEQPLEMIKQVKQHQLNTK